MIAHFDRSCSRPAAPGHHWGRGAELRR